MQSEDLNNYIDANYREHTLSNPSPNKVLLIGELLGIEENGFYRGTAYNLVLMRTTRSQNKAHYVWILLPQTANYLHMIKEQPFVYIEGILTVSPTFNNKAISHTFITPTKMIPLEGTLDLEDVEDFALNYTRSNRVLLEGRVIGTPWKETIIPLNKSVTRFPMLINVNNTTRKIYCTIWDDVNPLESIEKGMKLSVLGSYTMLKKERNLEITDGYVSSSLKNKLDSYVVLIQQLIELPDENSSN